MAHADRTFQSLRRGAVLALLLAAMAPLGAGAVTKLKPLKTPVAKPDQALVVIAVEAQYAVGTLTFADDAGEPAFALRIDAAASEYVVRTYSVPMGNYRLVALTLPDARRKSVKVNDAKPFMVFAGKVNYIGDLDVFYENGLVFRLRDRSGRLMTWLREFMPAMLTVAPLEFVGGDGDGWAGIMSGEEK
jgi:hypothetical protein